MSVKPAMPSAILIGDSMLVSMCVIIINTRIKTSGVKLLHVETYKLNIAAEAMMMYERMDESNLHVFY